MGIKEVLYSYKFRNCPKDPNRYMLHKRIRPGLVHGAMAYDRDWRKKFMFVKVGLDTSFPISWKQIVVDTERCEEGAYGVNKAIRESPQYRSLEFLISDFTLSCSIIWGCNPMMTYRHRSGVEAFELFKKVHETKNTGISLSQLPGTGPTVVTDGRLTSDIAPLPPMPKRVKVSDRGGVAILSSPQHERTPCANRALVGDLGSMIMSHDMESLRSLGIDIVLDQLQSSLQKSVTVCNFLKETSFAFAEELKREREMIVSLKQELTIEKSHATAVESTIGAKEAEILRLEKQIHDLKTNIDDLQAKTNSLEKEKASLAERKLTLTHENL